VLFFLLLFLAVLGLLLAFPKTRLTVTHNWRIWLLVTIVYAAFLFLHPYVFGLPGRIGESRFQKQLRPGMTRAGVIRLAEKYGGWNTFTRSLGTGESPRDWPSEGALYVDFTDWETFCIVGGNEYDLYFRPDWKLVEWKVQRWGNAC
jgi:hypothetical protein